MSGVIALFGLKNTDKKTLRTFLKENASDMFPRTFKQFFEDLNIQIVDLKPNHSLKDAWDKLSKDEIKLVIYIIDGSDETTFTSAKHEFSKLSRFIKFNKIPLLILVNKIELEISPNLITRIIEDFKLCKFVNRKWLVHKICTKTGDGKKECL
ncbi:MAG: ADP-ribosylation factor-like protein, partial [Candidatus Hodarchaeota archaeon]